MMTQTTQSAHESANEFVKSFQTLKAFEVTGNDGSSRIIHSHDYVVSYTEAPCVVYSFRDTNVIEPDQSSFSDFDNLLNSLDEGEKPSEDLINGRKWVAAKYYDDQSTLSSLRLLAGLSQKQLGAICEIEQPHISRYESGKHEPSLSISKKIAAALHVGLEDFYVAWANTRAQCDEKGTK